MAKSSVNLTFVAVLASWSLYKRNQGRIVRQLTALAMVLSVWYGAYTLKEYVLSPYSDSIRVGIPVVLAVIGAWIVFRAVNYSRFADFLVSVEAEMNKVSWASRSELYRATIVVIITMLFLGALLFLYDQLWVVFFRLIRFLEI